MRKALLGIALAVAQLVGCSNSDPEEKPFTDCALDDRVGTWRFTATEEPGGTCGSIASQLVVIDDPLIVLDGCMLDRPDWLSNNECELRRSYTCDTGDSCGPEVYVAITRQQSEDRVTGTVGLSGPCTDDLESCSSTYAVKWVRE